MKSDYALKWAVNILNKRREETGVNIDGKQYAMVKDRLDVFREVFGLEYGIRTRVTPKADLFYGYAEITDQNNRVIASGNSMVFPNSDEFTSHAPVEVAETSAIGRALAAFGLHGGEFASGDEVQKARPIPFPAPVPNAPIPLEQTFDQGQDLTNFIATEGRIIPSEQSGLLEDPEVCIVLVEKSLEKIGNSDDLAKYWNELDSMKKGMEHKFPQHFNQLKGLFEIRSKAIKTNGAVA